MRQSGTPLNRPPLGPVRGGHISGVNFYEKACFGTFRSDLGGHISGVLIRGVPLYFSSHICIKSTPGLQFGHLYTNYTLSWFPKMSSLGGN